jgi:hypothetical protein
MICYCCLRDVIFVNRVPLRGDRREPPPVTPLDPAYQAYLNNRTSRNAFIRPGCYHVLDNDLGLGKIRGQVYNLAGESRAGKPRSTAARNGCNTRCEIRRVRHHGQ